MQACKGASPIGSGVDTLGMACSLGVALIVTGVTIAVTKMYRVQLWFGWVAIMVTVGAMCTLHADTPLANAIGLPIILGVGCGFIYSAAYFPILAPLPISENAHALALFSFVKSFAGVCQIRLFINIFIADSPYA